MNSLNCTLLPGAVFLLATVGFLLVGDSGTDHGQAEPLSNDDEPKFKYVGSKSCKMCHSSVEHKSWTKTKMGQAFDTLKPGNAKEAKVKHNLDPEKDYTQDATCLKCHTTGFGHPGGYVIPDPKDKKAVRRAAKLENVGCESCHGPGSEYNKLFREILQTKRKYKIEELYAAGLQKITKDTCTSCHNEHSPTIDAGAPFDFETMKDKDLHERQEMKQREG